MPRWIFDFSSGTLTEEEKHALAQKLTKLYTDRHNPKFLINVIFNEHGHGNYYSNAETPAPAVFFIINHANVARRFKNEEASAFFHKQVDEIVRPVLEPKGLKWEYNMYEQPFEHWRVNGMVPPATKPEVWKQWTEENRPVPY